MMTQRKPKTAPDVLRALKGKGTLHDLVKVIESKSGQTFNRGYLTQVMHGQRRASDKLLRALSLPLNPVPVTPCAHCGKVPLKKHCNCRKRSRARTWKSLSNLTPQQVAYLLRTRKEYIPHE